MKTRKQPTAPPSPGYEVVTIDGRQVEFDLDPPQEALLGLAADLAALGADARGQHARRVVEALEGLAAVEQAR